MSENFKTSTAARSAPTKQKLPTKEVEVKGVGLNALHSKAILSKGDTLQFFHEKDNKADANAIAIRIPGTSEILAYVPISHPNRWGILREIKEGNDKCKIAAVDYLTHEDKKFNDIDIGEITKLWVTTHVPEFQMIANSEIVQCLDGQYIFYGEGASSRYASMEGYGLIGSSTFVDMVKGKSDFTFPLMAIEKGTGVSQDEIKGIWSGKGDVAKYWGSSVHAALELYHRHTLSIHAIANATKKDGSHYKNYLETLPSPVKQVLTAFVDQFGTAKAIAEPFIVDLERGWCTQVDRLVITNKKKKTCRIGDYKTWAELKKDKLEKAAVQMSFSKKILESNGWTVEPTADVFHLNKDNEWNKIEVSLYDADELIKEKEDSNGK